METHYMTPVIDTPAAGALELLLARNLRGMTDTTKRAWTRFLMSLALRNPETLAVLNAEMRHQLIAQSCANPEVREAYRASGDRRDIAAWVQEQYPPMLERAGTFPLLPLLIEELSKPFHAMRWFVFDLSDAATSLLTSDRPFFEQYGFGDPRYVVALPISPRLLFVAANDRDMALTYTRQPPETVVVTVNERLVAQAAAHVYGTSKADLAMIEEHLRAKCQTFDAP
jgi:hypothetical protein